MQADLYNDLQDAGLLPFAESWGVMSDVNRLLKGPPDVTNKENNGAHMNVLAQPSNRHANGSGPRGVGCGMMEDDKAFQPSLQQAAVAATNGHGVSQQPSTEQLIAKPVVDESTRVINEAAEAAAVCASKAIQQARQVVQEVTACTATRLTPMASSTQQSNGGRTTGRKASRSTAQQEQASKTQTAAAGKGLRQFALMVCEQVRERGRTTYNQVADVLVTKLTACDGESKEVPDDKTIRRRVYDAINVLMAMGIIEREKKNIIWKGLPTLGNVTTSPTCNGLQELKQERLRRISDVDRKQNFLQELVDQHAALDKLILRNATQPQRGGTEIHLPFLLLQARLDATVEVQISDDMQNVVFDIDSAFQLHDDHGVVKQLAAATAATHRADKPATPQQAHSSMQE